jgi:hypothetical protein
MPFAISLLTETQLIVAEEEQGTRFVESFRKFLLQGRFTVMDLDETSTLVLSIVPVSFVENQYSYIRTVATDIFIAERI